MTLAKNSKVALVYDRIVKWGGAENLLVNLHQIWPQADWYTLVYDRAKTTWADEFNITPSPLQKLPLAKSHHELLAPLATFAFEQFNLNEYDLVISVTSSEAKAVITLPKTLHLCICLTPTRYLWSHTHTYDQNGELGTNRVSRSLKRSLLSSMRKTDLVASTRPDHYLAISQTVADRIKKYYHRDSTVIYPPLGELFTSPRENKTACLGHAKEIKARFPNGYLLVVSRLVSHKNVDVAISACNQLKLPLVVIGQGKQESKLKKLAGETITYIPYLTPTELVSYYHHSLALIHPAEEDYGYAMVESLACSRPVVAPQAGSATELLKEGTTGFFYNGTAKGLAGLLAGKLGKIEKIRVKPNQYKANSSQEYSAKLQKIINEKL